MLSISRVWVVSVLVHFLALATHASAEPAKQTEAVQAKSSEAVAPQPPPQTPQPIIDKKAEGEKAAEPKPEAEKTQVDLPYELGLELGLFSKSQPRSLALKQKCQDHT